VSYHEGANTYSHLRIILMNDKIIEKYHQYLSSFPRFGSKDFLKLERIQLLLKKLGHPEKKLRGVQVAGTKGKGSVVAFLERILIEAGYKVGSFYSPYLVDLTEEIRINGRPITKEKMIKIINHLRPLVNEVEKKTGDRITWFELVTTIAAVHFVESKVDVAAMEVGLGGRLDATTALGLDIKVITNISYDHLKTLGNTISLIAREKAGIIKKGDFVITSAENKGLSLIKKRIRNVGANTYSRLQIIGVNIKHAIKKVDLTGTVIDIKSPDEEYQNLHLSLIGRHQATNFTCALGAVQALRQKGFRISSSDIIKAAGQTQHQARFHLWKRNPLIILDGAHNLASIKALTITLEDVGINPRKTIFIFGTKTTKKRIPEMLRELSSFSSKIIFPDVLKNPNLENFYSAEKLKKYYPKGKIVSSLPQSLAQAKRMVGKTGTVVICGSLYLIGEFLGAEKGIRTKRRIDDNIIESVKSKI